MKILVAADGSPFTERAIDFLIGHLAWFRDLPEIHLLNVQPPIASGRVRAFVSKDVIDQYYDEEGEAALKKAKEMLDARGIAYTAVKLVGEVGPTISAYAERNDFSLIVMGSHGHGLLGNLVMGSVATRVLATSKMPVLLIR